MDNIQNNMLNYVSKRNLKNYFNTQRNFIEIFPEENFNFNNSKYTHFLYLDKEEAIAYMLDFLFFVHTNYNNQVFYYDNYYSVLDEFKKYNEHNNILFYTKTKMGLNMANYNNELLLNCLKNSFGETHFVGDDMKIAFNEVVLKDKQTYTYKFFDFLTKKIDGYNNHKFIIEPIVDYELIQIENYFKGSLNIKYPPFYLCHSHQYSKEIKNLLLNKVVGSTPNKVFKISKSEDKTIALVIVNINNNISNIDILCDSEYYNSDISVAIDYICDYIFNNYDVKKISTINQNKGISFSCINSALVISHFKPDYSLENDYNGYSNIKYDLNKDDFINDNIIKDIRIIKFAN